MSASSSTSTTSPYRRRHFDDRSHSQTSLVRRARDAQKQLHSLSLPSRSPTPSNIHTTESGTNYTESGTNYTGPDTNFTGTGFPETGTAESGLGPHITEIIHWSAASGVEKILRSAKFSAQFGVPCCIQLSPSYILVGLSRGAVACFNYHQKLTHVFEHLDTENGEIGTENADSAVFSAIYSPVLCISVSSDGRLAAAGSADGRVTVWEFPGPKQTQTVTPHHVIHPPAAKPSTPTPRILAVAFVGDSYDFVTSDSDRSVFFHHGFSKFFKVYYTSEKVHECEEKIRRKGGTSDSDTQSSGQNMISQNRETRQSDTSSGQFHNRILDCQILPVGTSAQITDQIGLVAVITYNTLTVFSIRSLNNSGSSYTKIHFQVSRPKDVEPNPSCVGLLAWYPCIQSTSSAKLAYSWSNVVSVLEVDFSALPSNYMQIISGLKDKDRGIPVLPHRKRARFRFAPGHEVEALKWLNSEILCVVVQDLAEKSKEMCFFHCPKLTLVARERFPFTTAEDLNLQRLQNMLQIFRHRPVVLVEPVALYTGTTMKWADHLVSLLSEERFSEALWCAYDYYSSEERGWLLLYGLPHTLKERQQVVEPFLIKIMHEAVSYVSKPAPVSESAPVSKSVPTVIVSAPSEDSVTSSDSHIGVFLQVVSEIAANRDGILDSDLLDVIELVYEKSAPKNAFFESLSSYILCRKIPNLSPYIFKLLVQYSVENGYGERLTEMVCLLDISTLNIDMTLKLCRTHGLTECSVYIWNCVFHDFLTPLVELVEGLYMQDGEGSEENRYLVYSYMSYILSGRKFPTDEFMDEQQEILGREAICGLLFSAKKVDSAPFSGLHDSPFPYLLFFLQKNSFEMLATLNEFLENPVLNTETKNGLSRQYIMDAVLDTFSVNGDILGPKDYVQLAVFVARNYPKYHQFIRIADSVVQDSVDWLLREPDLESHKDRELALECILPFYFAPDETFLLEQMKTAEFYWAAFRHYVQARLYSKALDVWMQSQGKPMAQEIDFPMVADLLANTFSRGTVAEQSRVLTLLGCNGNYFFGNFPEEMAFLGGKYCSKIHSLALECSPADTYRYLQMLKEEEFVEPLARAYIGLSCTYAPSKVTGLVEQHKAVLGMNQPLLDKLREHNQYEAMAVVYMQGNQYEQALIQLIDAISLLGKSDEEEMEVERGVERIVTFGISICTQNPQTWGLFIEGLVTCPHQVDQAIYRSFRAIIDSNGGSSALFNSVLSQVMEKAQISNVRAILQDILTSFYFESEFNLISLSKVNDEIRKAMEMHRRDVLRGWLIRNKNCASCGKVVWGPDMADTYSAHQNMAMQERAGAHASGETPDLAPYSECSLVFFRCTHIYHAKCLRGLSEEKCVLCTE